MSLVDSDLLSNFGQQYHDESSFGVWALPNDTNCSAGIPWIYIHFGECVTTREHFAAFIIGFISLLLWLVPLFPQIWENYKRGNCDESISIYFLGFWFAGDTTNLIGAILTKQLPTQIYIGAYYIVQDTVLLSQYLYYQYQNRWRAALRSDFGPPRRRSDSPSALACTFLCFGATGYLLLNAKTFEHSTADIFQAPWAARASDADVYGTAGGAGAAAHHGRRLLWHFFNSATDELGYILGTVSAVCYLAGRVPQIWKNHTRGDTEGLSTAMFVIIIFGNITYGLSVLMAGEGTEYILRHLPWLVGSMGCCTCDSVMLGQIMFYDAKRRRLGAPTLVEDGEPLLYADDEDDA